MIVGAAKPGRKYGLTITVDMLRGEPMRAIDADALIADCNKYLGILNPDRDVKEYARIFWLIGILRNAPTIEPERKKGKWIEQDDCWDGVYYECSVCKEPFTLIDGTPSDNLYNFCPNCGADMTNS